MKNKNFPANMKALILLFILFYGSCTMPQENSEQLKEKIIEKFNAADGDFALAFKLLNSKNSQILINEKEVFHAASTMKTPVMIEVFKQANEGKFDLQDSILVKNEFKSIVDSSIYSMDLSEDSGEDLYHYIGKKRTIYQLVYDMITVSSNLAANILIDKVKAENVMRTMKEMGANDIQVLRGVEDIKAFNLGLNNTTTAYDLMIIFEKIAKGEIVSENACKEMINILLDQKLNTRIPALLPENVKVAHKTGSITGVGHDSGIVFLPDGRKYVLVILAKNLSSGKEGEKVEAEVSKLFYDYLQR